MARITVSELLFDPDFCDEVTIQRSVEVVGDDGIVSWETESYIALASIQASGGDDLTMTTDASRTGGTYEITTTFPLATATDLTRADHVIWNDTTFIVINVARFNNFGSQFEGLMTIKNISPGPRI
jgi:hypothetical protein